MKIGKKGTLFLVQDYINVMKTISIDLYNMKRVNFMRLPKGRVYGIRGNVSHLSLITNLVLLLVTHKV